MGYDMVGSAFYKDHSTENGQISQEVPTVIQVGNDGGLDQLEVVPACYWKLEVLPLPTLGHLEVPLEDSGGSRAGHVCFLL